MRKRAHHRELQLSNNHVCNFQLKSYFGSCVFWRLSSECQATRFSQGLFFIPLCIHFWCVSDVPLYWKKCLTTIKLTKLWLTSPIEAFHVEKSPKKGTKVLAVGSFLCVLWRISFGQGSGEMSKEYASKVSRLCHFRTKSFFFQKKVTQRWWTDILLPRSPSLAVLLESLAVALDLWHAMAIQLLAAQKVGHLPLSSESSWRGRMHDRDVDVHIGRKSGTILVGNLCFLRQKLFSLLCWAHKRKHSVSFKAKSNFNPFSPHMWKMSHFEELVPMKKIRQKFYFW